MDLPDEQLKEGYESFVQKYILDDLGFTVEQLKKVDLPIPVCKPEPHVDYQELDKGLKTPTGKFELKSAIMENHPEWGLDALPTYKDPPSTPACTACLPTAASAPCPPRI